MLYLKFVYIIVYELYLVKVQLGRKMNLASIQCICSVGDEVVY